MEKKISTNLFSGTYQYYFKYRPGIPEKVISIIIDYFNLMPSDRILDIGCGTGQIAMSMDGKCQEMVCMDSDSEMIKQAKLATKNSKIKFTWLNYGSSNLNKLKENYGIFKLATICRAFHWMDQKQVLFDLNNLISQDGGIAILGDGSFWTGQEKWQKTVKKIVQKYLGEERRAGKGKFKESKESWESIISLSVFNDVITKEVKIVRNWNTESIIGWLFSSSFATPEHFGEKVDDFKRDIKKNLLVLNPKDVFEEKAVFQIILAKRKK